ncbi:LTA synthase family protein [Collinsella intestinalis]|uniref:LTA synthase family protein n=1 Tax=Collinsella intestinalis TaxID=147207 RepID=UPI00195B3471|nr:LTA synthase family protein [Collinsella intestinalis]MBM6682807.1 LTA synthase family protein [Collinsella intestinalis]
MVVAIISFIAAVASIALGVFANRRFAALPAEEAGAPAGNADAPANRTKALPFRTSGIVWGVVFTALQVFIGVWAALGLVQNDVLSSLIMNLVLTACAVACFTRPHLTARLRALTAEGGRFPHPLAASIIALVLAGVFATFGLEIPSNHDITWMYPLCLLLEFALITVAMAGLFFISQRRGGASAFLALALCMLGIAEYFVILFKSMPIQPGDLFALSTAAAVSAGYTYTLSAYCLYGIALAAVAALLCLAAGAWRPERAQRSRRGLVINLIVGVLCLAGITAHVTLIDYYNTLGIQIYTWRPLESYYRQGYLPSFISSAQTIIPPKPKNYSTGTAEKLLDEYVATYDEQDAANEARTQATAQFDEEKPTVIAIMNETFSDLSIYQNLHAGYEGPTFFKSISDAVARGTLYVSAYGGGTCNTEFEFLTGNSMAYLGNGVYPYSTYNLTQTKNLAQQFSDLGYATTAMHPNHGTNWNRENVYRDFGFDNFLTINDFADADRLRGMVTDEATYDKILDLLNENSDPQFIFDVTMQNHSGYETGLLPYDKQVNYLVDGVSDPEVNEYLALIQESDRALEEFLSKLEKLDRKVVLVFFGDHQPFFPDTYNDAWFTNEDEAVHAERLWQTDYVIWANYDVAGSSQTSEQVDTSTNYLGSMLLELIGAPLTDYQKAQIAARTEMPAINTTGYCDADGTWFLTGEKIDAPEGSAAERAATTRYDLSMIQYFELFGHGDGIFTKHQQDAANETDPNLAPGTTKIK